MAKKGQNTAGGASALIAIIAGMILLYLLLLPPDVREDLLQDQPSSEFSGEDGTGDNAKSVLDDMNNTVLEESPGRISYLRFDEFDHNLPAINLYTETEGKEKTIGNALYVKKGVFDEQSKNIEFQLPKLEQVENVYLDFKLSENRNNQGRLKINLNDEKIFSQELPEGRLGDPIKLQDRYLERENELEFSVSGVGWKFWTTNEYELDNIRVIYDKKDVSKQESKNTFMIDDTEKHNLDSAVLKFNPDCNPRNAGILTVLLNRNVVYEAVPDCGQLNKIEISSSMVHAGKNTIRFSAEEGHYLINRVNLQTKMEKMTFPVYYFDLKEELFNIHEEKEDEAECGEVDGVCPADCPEYKDKDCCLQKTSKYWCDMDPENANDRCRSVVYEKDCQSCPSGYEDREGNPPEVCEGKCGDDTDGECPSGCSRLYDKDCCFEQAATNYWCDEVPKYGLSYRCREGIHVDDCDDCPSGYETEEGRFKCPDKEEDTEERVQLKDDYVVWLTFKFLDDGNRKAAKVFVNGYQFYVDTHDDIYERRIGDYLEDGSNAIKIEPDMASLDIIKMEVEVEES